MRTQGVDGDIVAVIVAGKKKELDAMEAFGIFDVCEELPERCKGDHNEMGKRSEGRQVEMQIRSQRVQT